jgi:hypothetical protein
MGKTSDDTLRESDRSYQGSGNDATAGAGLIARSVAERFQAEVQKYHASLQAGGELAGNTGSLIAGGYHGVHQQLDRENPGRFHQLKQAAEQAVSNLGPNIRDMTHNLHQSFDHDLQREGDFIAKKPLTFTALVLFPRLSSLFEPTDDEVHAQAKAPGTPAASVEHIPSPSRAPAIVPVPEQHPQAAPPSKHEQHDANVAIKDGHMQVEKGDSYWSIAQRELEQQKKPASNQAIARVADQLATRNKGHHLLPGMEIIA